MIKLPFANPGNPDTRSPIRFLVWVGRQQLRTLLGGVFFGVLWMVSQALMPAAIGRAIQDGIVDSDNRALADLDADPARARRDDGRGWRHAAPLRGLELAAGLVPHGAGRRTPRRPHRARDQERALDRRGRGDGLERRHARGRSLRHHSPALRRDRVVHRRRGDPALRVGDARARGPPRRARARAADGDGDQAAPGPAGRATRGGRKADRSRRGHRRGAARAARDRRRERVLPPLPEPLAGGAAGRRPRCASAVDPRRGPGLHTRALRRPRHLAQRTLRSLRADRRRRPGRLLRVRRVPRAAVAHGCRSRRQDHAVVRRREEDARDPRRRA